MGEGPSNLTRRSPQTDLTETNLAERLQAARLDAFLRPPGSSAAEPIGELDALLSRTAEVYSRAVTDETRADYIRRWQKFQQWCTDQGLTALPAAPATVMMYLSEAARTSGGPALSTLRGRMAAISRIHLEAGFPSPSSDPGMTTFLRGLSRVVPPRPRSEPISALRIAALRLTCQAIDAAAIDPTEVRDRAILIFRASGLTDYAIARLDWSQVRLTRRQIRVTTPLKDRGQPQDFLLRASDGPDCPVMALEAWASVVPREGRIFRLVEFGSPSQRPLTTKRVQGIRESRATALGRDGRSATLLEAAARLGQVSSFALRDRAMLLLGFAGAFRRNEITNLCWSDLREFDSGMVVRLRRSKTDQQGRGCDVGVPYGMSPLTCPVRALIDWRQRVTEALGDLDPEGPVFTHITRPGRITSTPIGPEALTLMIQRRMAATNLDGHWGGRSLRAGFISTAADLDIPLEAIARQSRHKTLDSLALYIREVDPFRRNPAGKVGL